MEQFYCKRNWGLRDTVEPYNIYMIEEQDLFANYKYECLILLIMQSVYTLMKELWNGIAF